MFVDRVKVKLVGGNGGNGMASFRREKYVPFGGPYGGDGGRGGHIIFEADSNKSTLLDLRFNKIIKAKNGEAGKNKKMHGADATDVIVKVPLGTIIKDAEKDIVIADLTKHGQQEIIAFGGRGGRGNIRFASANNPAPNFAEKGELGEEKEIEIELKLLADVGLVGYPSVGKSTLLSVISEAKPEIADYHFTTINPNLGIAQTKDGRSFAVADLPGLIEDASSGKGMGFQFLKHIERTRLLCHVVDMGSEEGRDPVEDYAVINQELEKYNPEILEKPMLVVANKMDLDGAEENLERFKKAYPNVEVFPVMTIVGEGIEPLLYKIADILDEQKLEDKQNLQNESVVYKFEPRKIDYDIERINQNTWRVSGSTMQRQFRQFDFKSEESLIQFAMMMKRSGLEQLLREQGVQDGDTIIIEDAQFVFDEGSVE